MTDVNYVNNILSQGQALSNLSSGDYITFQKQLVATKASFNNDQIRLGLRESDRVANKAIERNNVASSNLDLQRQYLNQDYSTYMGYFNVSQALQRQASQVEINTYLSNAKNLDNAAMYNMSKGITATTANVGRALSYFSASEASANSGSARDIEFNMIDEGYQEGSQNYAAAISKANDFITEANHTSINSALSALSAQEQAALLRSRMDRQLNSSYNINSSEV